MKKTKSFSLARFKALPEEGDGTFEAIVSVFNNVDMIGDKVVPGAFKNSIQKWSESGDPIPVIWSHQWDNPEAHIGIVDPSNAKEVEEGLFVKGQIDTDKPFAKHVYDLLSARRVKEFSFAYDVLEEKEVDGANELREMEIIEVGPTLKGMNPETQLLAVKSALQADLTKSQVADLFGVKAGRVLSSKNEEKIRSAIAALNEVLSTLDEEDGDEKTPPPTEAAKEAEAVKSAVKSLETINLEIDLEAIA